MCVFVVVVVVVKKSLSEEPKYSMFTEQLKHKGIGHPLVVVDSGVPYS